MILTETFSCKLWIWLSIYKVQVSLQPEFIRNKRVKTYLDIIDLFSLFTGHIVECYGPYVARNNDSDIIKHVIEEDEEGLRAWTKPGDIQVVDRGYRDATDAYATLGIKAPYPAFIPKGVSNI